MVVGFNHNFTYKGAVYHIQTEDSGRKSPAIVTLLYHGGTILASRKTSYADIAKVDHLEQVVEELMKEQHKGMLRSLKNGEFDDVIARLHKSAAPVPATAAPAPEPAAASPGRPTSPDVPAVSSAPAAAQLPPRPAPPSPAPPPAVPASPAAASPAAEAPSAPRPATVESSLDEIILSYLMGEDK